MATTALSGHLGTVTGAGAGGASEIVEWEATLTHEAIEATSMTASAGYREFVQGLKGCTGTFTCIGADPQLISAAATLTLTCTATTPSLSGLAVISSVGYKVNVDGRVEYTCAFTYTGTITVT